MQTTGPIRQSRASDLIPGIGRSPELAKRLNSLTEKNALVDTVLEVGKRLVVTRLKTRTEPDIKKLDDERKDITKRLKRSRQIQLFGSWQAVLYGPVQQRKTFKQFGSSALMSMLNNRSNVKINESAFPIVKPTAPAKK